jgi:hypothetical protein
MCSLLWFVTLEYPRVTAAAAHWRQRSTTTRRGETKTPHFYGGGQSSIGMGRSHAARQLLELSGQPRLKTIE